MLQKWMYKGKFLDTNSIDVKQFFGFNYIIKNLKTKKLYIGKKYLWSFRRLNGKKRKTKVESNWKNYWGSSVELKNDIKKLGKHNFIREILDFYYSKSGVDLNETRKLFQHDVLNKLDEKGDYLYYNECIAGKWYRGNYT